MNLQSRRILIVCKNFYPKISPRSFRATELAKEFSRQGHLVTVMIPESEYDYSEFTYQNNIKVESFGKLRFSDIQISGRNFRNSFKRIVRKFLRMFFEFPDIELVFLLRKSLIEKKDYDILISIAVPYPIHWGVAFAIRGKNEISRKWIADCGDPYCLRENDSIPFYFSFVEKWFMRKADFISVPTQNSINGYFKEFHSKIRVIPQGFRFEDYRFDEEKRNTDIVSFAYAGMFIPGRRDPTELIDYLLTLNIEYRFHIFTATPDLVKEKVNKSRGRILLYAPVPRFELMRFLSQMDFLVNFENTGIIHTPSKHIDFIILNKPALSIRTRQLDTDAVNSFLSGDYSKRMVFEKPEQYRIENICHKFLDLLN